MPENHGASRRTDNPVRPPERTPPRPASGWIHGLTDRIVRPPRILPLTADPQRSRAVRPAPRPPAPPEISHVPRSTVHPVRPSEQLPPKPAFATVHGLAVRIVHPPRILPLTADPPAISCWFVGLTAALAGRTAR